MSRRSQGRTGWWWAGVATAWTLAALTGCQNVTNAPGAQQSRAQGALGPTGPDLAQTSFKAEVSTDQEYNVHMDLGKVFELQGSPGAAVAEYQRAIEVCQRPAKRFAPKTTAAQLAKAHRRMAGAMDRMGQFAQSERHYREALALSPNDPTIWNDAGYSYYLQSRFSDAERALKSALQMAPGDPKALTNLGLTLAASGKAEEAFQALAQVAGPAGAHANLGYVLASTGNKQEARRHYMAALQMQPNFVPFRSALTRLDHEMTSSPIAQITANSGPAAFWQDPNIARASALTGIPVPKPIDLTLHAN